MHAQVWFEGYFFLLLHGTTVLSTAYDKRLILSLNNSTLKVVSGKNYSKVGIILEVNNEAVVETWMVKRSNAPILLYRESYIFYSVLLLKDTSS